MSARLLWRLWLPLYIMLLGSIIAGLLYARQQALAIYKTDQARSQWQQWASEARQQEEEGGPVHRRAPKTDTPPALIMMRDYAAVAFTAAIVLTSAVYWTFAFMLNGVLSKHPMRIDAEPE